MVTDSHTLDVLNLLDDVIRNRRGTSIFTRPGVLTNLGVIWQDEITKVGDLQLATEAVAHLYANFAFDRIPTPVDFRDTARKIKLDRAPRQIEPPSPFARDMPTWVKGWALARYAHRDMRVWPQQQDGYDRIQKDNPFGRTHVWPDQEKMPPDEQERYEREGDRLNAEQIAALIGGGVPQR